MNGRGKAREMKLFKILSEKRYLATAVAATFVMLLIFPTFQSLGNLDIWFTFISPLNFVLYMIFSILFGITMSIQYHSFRQKIQACELKSASSQAGSILGIFAFQCPACIPILAQALGFNTVIFLSAYRTPLMLIGLVLMFVSLYLLGAFTKGS